MCRCFLVLFFVGICYLICVSWVYENYVDKGIFCVVRCREVIYEVY